MITSTASSTDSLAAPPRSRGLHIALWVVQILLAVMFGMAGFMKATQPMDQLAKSIPWTPVVGMPLTRFIGVSEFAGALGLILPAATRIMPRLTGIAAAALTLVMILALGYHVMHGEYQVLPIPGTLGCLAAFVTWGRLVKAPISPRG
jgi:uncharacterized membrane protein YphA (DoxX/SURF4 family)